MTRRGKQRLVLLSSFLLLVSAAAAGAYFLREARRTQRAEAAYRDGMAAYDEGRFEDALRGLGKALTRYRDDAEVLYRVADVRRRVPIENARHLTAAIAFSREAASLAPTDPRPLELLVTLYQQVGFVTECLDAVDRLLRIDARHEEAHLARIECLSTLGRQDEAKQAIDALIEAHPEGVAGHELKVRMMRLAGESAETVLAYVDALVSASPDHIGFAAMQVRQHSALGRREEARLAATRLLEKDITDPHTLLDVVRTLDLLGLRSEADQLLERSIARDLLRNEGLESIVERAWKLGREDRVRAALAQIERDFSTAPSRLLGWSALMSMPADGAWADTPVGEALRDRPDEEAARWRILLDARSAMTSRRFIEARERLNEAISLNGADDLACFWLAEVMQRLGETDLAAECVAQAIAVDPSWSRAYVTLAAFQIELGRLDEARSSAERALVLNPGAAEALTLARTYVALLDAGRGDRMIAQQALTILEEAAALMPDEPDVLAMLARTCLVADKPQEAGAAVDRIGEASRLPAPATILDLALAAKQRAPDLLPAILDLAARLDSPGPELLAMLAARSGGDDPQSRLARFREMIARETDESRRVSYEITYARLLEQIGDPSSLDEYRRLAAAHPSLPAAQQALLDSTVAWSDESLIAAAIENLKKATGEGGAQWRIAQARRRLAFDAADAAASEVVVLLAPLTRPPSPDIRALVLASDAMLRLNDRAGAITMLARAVDRQPENALLHLQIIRLLQETGRSVEAGQRLREFVTRQNLSPGEQRQRVELLQRQALWGEAIRDAEDLAAATGEMNDILALARLYWRRGREADARREFEKVLAQPTLDAPSSLAAAVFFASTESLERGVSVLERLRDTLDADAYTSLLAQFHERLNRIDDAAAILLARAEGSGNPDHWAALAQFHLRHQRTPSAREAVERGLAETGNHELLQTLLGVVNVVETQTLDPEILENVVDTMVAESARPAMRQIAQAIEHFAANPEDVSGYVARLKTAVDEHPQLLIGWQLLVRSLSGAGRMDEAVTAAQSAASMLPASVRAAELLARALAEAGRFDEARAAVMRWRELEVSDRMKPDLLLAQIDRATGRSERAFTTLLPYVERIEREAEESPAHLELFASVLVQTGRQDAAHDLLWPRVQQSGEWARAYLLLTNQIASPADRLPWIDRIEPLLPLTPTTRVEIAAARSGLGHALGQPEQFERVVALLEPTVNDPQTPLDAIMLSAEAHEQMARRDRAIALYRLALDRQPDNAFALNNLAFALLQEDSPSEEPLTRAMRAVEIARREDLPDPVLANMLETLGSAHLALGQFAQAETAFAEGLALDPSNALLGLGRAQALIGLGRVEEARTIVESSGNAPEAGPPTPHFARRLEIVQAALASQP